MRYLYIKDQKHIEHQKRTNDEITYEYFNTLRQINHLEDLLYLEISFWNYKATIKIEQERIIKNLKIKLKSLRSKLKDIKSYYKSRYNI